MESEGVKRSDIDELEEKASKAFSEASDMEVLEDARVRFLGRKGKITEILRSVGRLPPDERPVIGGLVNDLKQKLRDMFEDRKSTLSTAVEEEEFHPGDQTLPGRSGWTGGLHILHKVLSDIKEIFFGMGYSLAEGPDVELDYYNFEALNFPKDHPSRDLQDTFYINSDILLRTQTSPVQVRYMEKNEPPMRIIAPGRVYRNESPDPSHASEFLQMEGLCVDRDISLADLRNDVTFFIHSYFGPEASVRFRPHFFPFTEPSAEVDMSCFACKGKGCSICGKTGWIEIIGAGMVHPHVFRYAGYDPDAYTGFAFGMGIDRIAMLKYGIDDIRRFLDNDLRFLKQFWTEV
ncbi:MAG: phenylalanine--tRNA ligase subunit alpha [Candidatus Krumholzibacteria bacterium]|nr:phenylalanine--tRNA ligase subunit alpha [Candidatus Krumholzibacteria bacterium]